MCVEQFPALPYAADGTWKPTMIDRHNLANDLVDIRRAVHRSPEIGLHLPRTQQLVVDAIADLPVEVTVGKQLSSVVAVLRGAVPGPTVLLRGDMDALPVHEEATLRPRSEIDGVMHACGHDLHVAMLIGAARLLAERRDQLRGNVVLMFQPGEEGHNGAGLMIDEGVLDVTGTRPVAAYALHVTSARFPTGVFAARVGAMMASSDVLSVRMRGAGGHGSAPHLAQDPVPAACEAVLALQTVVTRAFDVFDPVVVTVGSLHAGTTGNVIPDSASFDATVRSFSAAARAKLAVILPRVALTIAEGHGLAADVEFVEQYPVMVNDETETEFAARTVAELFGPDSYQSMAAPLTSSEDFARVLAEVPGAYLMLGACPDGADPATAAYNHAPEAKFDESVLLRGAELLAELAVRRLAQQTREPVGALDGGALEGGAGA